MNWIKQALHYAILPLTVAGVLLVSVFTIKGVEKGYEHLTSVVASALAEIVFIGYPDRP